MRTFFTLFSFILVSGMNYGQPHKTLKVFKPYHWMIGIHLTAIDDNGNKFERIFDTRNSWNMLPYPSKISLDKYFKYGWSMELTTSYMRYSPGKLINDSTQISGNFVSTNIHGKYSFYQRYAPRARWIDPFVTLGLGYTYRQAGSRSHVPTINAGAGVNFWFSKVVGIRVSSTANFGFHPTFWQTSENYLQHSAGMVVRLKRKSSRRSQFQRRNSKWSSNRRRYKTRKGGQ